MNHELTDDDVIRFALAGCNVAEIAAYAGVSPQTAAAMLARARALHARPQGDARKAVSA